MDDKENGLDRRDFLNVSSTALGGGLLYLSSSNTAEAGPGAVASTSAFDLATPLFTTPHRLSDTTHQLARRGLSGEHGRALVSLGVEVDDLVETKGMSEDMRVAHAIKIIAEKAPLRILPGERIVCSATLLEAAGHYIPLCHRSSVSHTTLGFDKALRIGYGGFREQINERLSKGGLDARGVDLLKAMMLCLDAAAIWHDRNIDLLKRLIAGSLGEDRSNYERVLENMRNVPENPPTSFAEAVQSLWSMYAFQRLCGQWSGIGRIDEMLGPYLMKDLASGKITLDEARELMAHFWIKGTEWAGLPAARGSGDAQFYQNIILGGVDALGHEVTNEVTYLVLDVVEELHISDFPIAVRLNRNSPEKLLRRVAEVQRHGGGIVALYNEEVVIEALVKFGYPVEEARRFSNDGCWEAIIPGKTNFSYVAQDSLYLMQTVLGLNDTTEEPPAYADFESLYAAFYRELAAVVDTHHKGTDGYDRYCTDARPAPLVSLFVDDCIERGRGYHDRGAKYSVLALHLGGLANTANSLLAIQKIVYDEKLITFKEFVEILRSNWAGQENLRKMVSNRVEFYGNDNDEADAMVKRIFDDYTSLVAQVKESNGVLRPAGISTFGREITWKPTRRATADGHLQGEILATNFSPSPGSDKKGPTAALKSYCKMDFSKLPNIGTIELKILPASAKGEAGVRALMGLMRGFVKLGGCFMHVDVVDSAMLLDAQRHPDKYPNLSVRIAGWSARFATLNKDWQDMVIGRTQQVV